MNNPHPSIPSEYEELRRFIAEEAGWWRQDTSGLDSVHEYHRGSLDRVMDKVESYAQKKYQEAEKAYGGCHNCYGKGYATVSDEWIGYDTDTDIGSPGGVVRGGSPDAVKFCDCSRGKQLEKLMTDKYQEGELKGRIAENEHHIHQLEGSAERTGIYLLSDAMVPLMKKRINRLESHLKEGEE